MGDTKRVEQARESKNVVQFAHNSHHDREVIGKQSIHLATTTHIDELGGNQYLSIKEVYYFFKKNIELISRQFLKSELFLCAE